MSLIINLVGKNVGSEKHLAALVIAELNNYQPDSFRPIVASWITSNDVNWTLLRKVCFELWHGRPQDIMFLAVRR